MTKSIDEAQWLALYKAELVVLSIVKYIMYCGDFFLHIYPCCFINH
jgi:hypothetical protein